MSGKDSKRKSSTTVLAALSKHATPPLVNSYINAIRQICGLSRVRVQKAQHGWFMNRQTDLNLHSIAYDDYALSVVNAWWPWCKRQGMKSVPATLFCGDKAFDRHLHERDVFRADTKSADIEYEILYNELIYAEIHIHNRLFPLRMLDVRRASKLYRHKDASRRPVEDALAVICDAYGMTASSYDEVADTLKRRMGLH